MDTLKNYAIPFQGLKLGVHQFEFQIDSSFFTHFENSSIEQAAVHLIIEMDKRPNMLELIFNINGSVKSECDRCLERIDLPIKGEYQMLVKFSEEPREGNEEVIYIHPKTAHINIASYAYEFIHLSVPMRKLKPICIEMPEECENNMLVFYDDEDEEFEEEDIKEENINPLWDELNKFEGK